jgi:hydrogenase maturation protease
MNRNRILIAGIGNIFLGDDAFGVEVVHALAQRRQPPEVSVVDFGIRSYDLAYALTDGYDAVILVDATPRGEPPGTVSLIEPDLSRLNQLEHEAVDAHSLNPVAVLHLAQALGGQTSKIYLVGCEPADLVASEDGDLGLSETVHAAVPAAVAMIESLVEKLLDRKPAGKDLNLTETERKEKYEHVGH